MYIKYAIAYNTHMPRHTEHTDLINQVLSEIANQRLTMADILTPAFGRKLLPNTPTMQQSQLMRSALRYCKYNQLILQSNNGLLSVTDKAKKRLAKFEIEHIIVTKPKKWDKKWRLVAFELPEKHKTQRDAFAKKLKHLGFKNLQDGVWILPYACQSQIKQISEFYKIENYVTYAEVSYISSQDSQLKLFAKLMNNRVV